MRIVLFLIGLILFNTSIAQNCYSVKNVTNKGEIEGINPKRFTLGVKQITEEILSEKYSICDNGDSVSVVIESIEAPTTGIALGPFEKKRKLTIVKLKVIIKGKEYEGVGESKTDVKSTFIELQDENLPFEKSAFSAGLKKGIQDALNKL